MIYEKICLADERLTSERKTDRFAAVLKEWKKLSSVDDAELENMLKAIYKEDEELFVPCKHELQKTKMPGFKFFRGEARIVNVFTVETELMMRDPDCSIGIDDVIDLYLAEVADLKRDHLYYQRQNGKTDDYSAEEQQDRQVANALNEANFEEMIDLIVSSRQTSTVEKDLLQSEHEKWLATHFPFGTYKTLLDERTIHDLRHWLTFMSQSFAERFFMLDVKSVQVFYLIVFRGMKQKDVADSFGETPGAVCKRWNKVIFTLFTKQKGQIKKERAARRKYWKEYKRNVSRIKKEYTIYEMGRMNALKNTPVRIIR